jgi:hypothetical protein
MTVFAPIREQLMVALEFIRISEQKKQVNVTQELMQFKEYFTYVVRQIEIYVNYEILKAKKNG